MNDKTGSREIPPVDNPYRHNHSPLNGDFHGGICSACEWERTEGPWAEPQWLDDNVKTFAEAQVGDHAYTWEPKGSHDFGEYRFETAGDPREFYDGCGRIVRKRWELIEIVELDADDE